MSYIETDSRGKQYTSDDGMTIENEVREFICGLVTMMKPDVILETGCYHGNLSNAIVQKMFGGYFFTCDTDANFVSETLQKLRSKVNIMSDCFLMQGTEGILHIKSLGLKIDLAILDSSGDRMAEAMEIIDAIKPGGIVIIHDSNRSAERAVVDYFCLPDRIRNGSHYCAFHFDTPRGLAVLQKQ